MGEELDAPLTAAEQRDLQVRHPWWHEQTHREDMYRTWQGRLARRLWWNRDALFPWKTAAKTVALRPASAVAYGREVPVRDLLPVSHETLALFKKAQKRWGWWVGDAARALALTWYAIPMAALIVGLWWLWTI